MWRNAACLIGALCLFSTATMAQTPLARPAPPIAAEGWVAPGNAGSAPAQQGDRVVADPWRPYAPVTPGVNVGQARLYPSITAGAFYDDNVFATHSNRQG